MRPPSNKIFCGNPDCCFSEPLPTDKHPLRQDNGKVFRMRKCPTCGHSVVEEWTCIISDSYNERPRIN